MWKIEHNEAHMRLVVECMLKTEHIRCCVDVWTKCMGKTEHNEADMRLVAKCMRKIEHIEQPRLQLVQM